MESKGRKSEEQQKNIDSICTQCSFFQGKDFACEATKNDPCMYGRYWGRGGDFVSLI